VSVVVELVGLEVSGRHGVEEDERREARTFLFDVRLEVSDASLSDRIEDAVDYREVAACVREISDGRQFHLLEALAAEAADAIGGRFPVEHVLVRVRKPAPPGLGAEFSAATAERGGPEASRS
jgi:7,8-dihydroneopterin aldolase/epimerase/oxygenase